MGQPSSNIGRSTYEVLEDAKDPLLGSGVLVQPLSTLCDTDNQPNEEETDRDQDLVEQGLGQGVVDGRVGGGLYTSGALLDDEDERAKDDDADSLEDVTREEDKGGCLRISGSIGGWKGTAV